MTIKSCWHINTTTDVPWTLAISDKYVLWAHCTFFYFWPVHCSVSNARRFFLALRCLTSSFSRAQLRRDSFLGVLPWHYRPGQVSVSGFHGSFHGRFGGCTYPLHYGLCLPDFELLWAVGLKPLQSTSVSPGGLVKARSAGPHPRVSDPVSEGCTW